MNTRLRVLAQYVVIICILLFAGTAQASTYYINCTSATNGSGSSTDPWNSLTMITGHVFAAGDKILFNRGTTCYGPLAPLGSGSSSGSPIVIDAYGTGAQPIIDGGTNIAALQLSNQQYWEINNLEIVHGDKYGVYVTHSFAGTIYNHIYLTNLNVHGATHQATFRLDGGEVWIDATGSNGTWNDVKVTGVQAHDTTVSQGIYVVAGGVGSYTATLGSNVLVDNSAVNLVGGDGILVIGANGATIQNSIVSGSGTCPSTYCSSPATPGGLWVYQCTNCLMQSNESYGNQTWGASDGGDFDIDYVNNNVIAQYNYGHDSVGYCISVFGAGGITTTNSVIRYNVCANNERSLPHGKGNQGEIFLSTWDGGVIDNVQIYNNTFYWNPVSEGSVLYQAGTPSVTGTHIFENNIVYATGQYVVNGNSVLQLSHNLYYTPNPAGPKFYNGTTSYTSLSAYQTATSQDSGSIYKNPAINGVGYHATGTPTDAYTLQPGSPAIGAGALITSNGGRDFFSNTVSATAAPNIGAYNGAGVTPGNLLSNPGFEGGSLGVWSPWNTATITTTNPNTGTYALTLSNQASVEQTVTGLASNTTYTFGGWARGASGTDEVRIGVKTYGGSEIYQSWSSSAYGYRSVTFTTGSTNTSAVVYAYHALASGTGYADDLSLTKDLVANPGFEAVAGVGNYAPWTRYNASLVSSPVNSGAEAMQVTNGGSSEQTITGLKQNSSYVLSAYGNQSSGSILLGVKNQGAVQVNAAVVGSTFAPYAINFTTGTGLTSATIFLYNDSGASAGTGTADDFVVSPSLLVNPGFEWGTTGAWTMYGTYSLSPTSHSGRYALDLNGSSAGAEQIVSDLQPNTTYILGGWLKADSTSDAVNIGIKNFGGTEIYLSVSTGSYTWKTVTFTTGSANTSAQLYIYKASGGGNAYADDLTLSKAQE